MLLRVLKMKNRWTCLIGLLYLVCSVISVEAQVDLHQKISIDAQGVTIPQILTIIERQNDFYFAYNPDCFSKDNTISLSVNDKSIKQVLNDILPGSYSYQAIGDHIILHPEEGAARPENYYISGVVTNGSGAPLDSVVIYAVNENKAIITDLEGTYRLKLEQHPQYINISHPNYQDTLILADDLKNGEIIRLSSLRKKTQIEKVEMREATLTSTNDVFEEVRMVKKWVPDNAMYVNAQVKTRFYNPVQFSVIPGIGSGMLVRGLKYNCFSINMIAGYSKGVSGVEIGGVTNIIQEDVLGGQFAGVSNIVKGETQGVQMAGIWNSTFDDVYGFQVSGIGNDAYGTMRGIQMAGIINKNKGPVNGAQIGGIGNMSFNDLKGVQFAGISNVLSATIQGVQISGIYNFASKVEGVQFSGIMNQSLDPVKGVQVGGINNLSPDMKGVQFGGIFNQTLGDMSGVQLSGVMNKTKKLRGVQFGIVNIADTVEAGVQVGLLNIIKKGYRVFEVTSNETYALDFMYKTGGRFLYSTVNLGVDENEFGIGFGIGVQRSFSDALSLNLDVIATSMYDTFDSDFNERGQKLSFRLAFNYDFMKHGGITCGPSFNMFVPMSDKSNSFSHDISFEYNNLDLISKAIDNNEKVMWFGAFVGIRIY